MHTEKLVLGETAETKEFSLDNVKIYNGSLIASEDMFEKAVDGQAIPKKGYIVGVDQYGLPIYGNQTLCNKKNIETKEEDNDVQGLPEGGVPTPSDND